MDHKAEVDQLYGNRVRVRVCGIGVQEDKILLVRHEGVGERGTLWSPPGGGFNFGESAEETVKREYREETGLEVAVKEFLFINEYLAPPLHALELFFSIEVTGGIMAKGFDPEMGADKQIIQEVRYWSLKEIQAEDPLLFHAVLRKIRTFGALLGMKGYVNNFK